MKIIFKRKNLVELIHSENNLGFVPTMGGIHLGHLSLIRKSIKLCNKTIVSIFVNKPQFNRKGDFINYPRSITKDISKLKKLNIDYLYIPSNKQIYPNGPTRKIKINSFAKQLCGKNRPGHFIAVVDVIDRFIKIIKPSKIFFGEKDMQQLKLVESFIKKNHPKIKVISCKTIREKDGLALSSRNFHLSINEKKIASGIYKLLLSKKKYLIKRNLSPKVLEKTIYDRGVNKIDYIKVLDINKLIRPYKNKKRYRIFIAYYLGATRLIDNI